MHVCEKKYIRVSDISSYRMCPRIPFFRIRDHHGAEYTEETLRSDVLREISVSLCSVAFADDRLNALKNVYDSACDDLATIYGLTAEEVRAAARLRPENLIQGLERESARLGRERLLRLLRPEETRISLRSDKLRLSGTVDRIVKVDGTLMPAIVSSSLPPENGIYTSDRIRLAAYALLIGEKSGCEVEHGIVEYMGGWRIREAEIRRGDKREALSIRRRIEEIGSAMPDARRGKWCEKCGYKDRCVVRVTFLDSLFGKS